jgi:hypothetical protein
MTPEEKNVIDIVFIGLMINVVWFIGLLMALLKIR